MLQLEFGVQEVCMDLLRADTEEEVISILRQQGYWDDPTVWEPFGGKENNFPTMGNQTSKPEAALVEKLVNSVDAVLMGECWSAGIAPESQDAPQAIAEAVAWFFGGDRSRPESMGDLARWDARKRRRVADLITLAATGSRQNLSFTIVDAGEGQSPNAMPNTLLSLDRENKVKVQFVQGKFNMGGTGALRFCGYRNIQLIISKRKPSAPAQKQDDDSVGQWGFTVVRREDPTGQRRISMYTYLSPLPEGVLRFTADALQLFPQGNRPYDRATEWGTAIKLYEYQLTGKSHILRGDGLLQRLDLLLPRIALPIRLHECRNYGGGSASYDTTLSGLSVRLTDDKSDNLEPGFPSSSFLSIRGQQLPTTVYAFKRGKANNYKRGEGIVFTVEGQTHGQLPQNFFARRGVVLDGLRDSLLAIVDCSGLELRIREDLFMNSRDRMEEGELLTELRRELETFLREHPGLRALKEERRREEIESKLQDSKPFLETLEAILRKAPALALLFGGTGRLPNPFRPTNGTGDKQFVGKPHPTYFRFHDLASGKILERVTAINMRSRISFDSDVVNDYFGRAENAGRYRLRWLDRGSWSGNVPNHSLNLHNGVATLNLSLPSSAGIGDLMDYELSVHDETLISPFINRFTVKVGPFQKPGGGTTPPTKRNENGVGSGKAAGGVAVPEPNQVFVENWYKHDFDKFSAMRVVLQDSVGDPGYVATHDYFINMDNIYLQSELKATKVNPEIVRAQWKFGMMILAVALLRESAMTTVETREPEQHASEDSTTPEDKVALVTRALAPVLLPLVEHLGGLTEEEFAQEE